MSAAKKINNLSNTISELMEISELRHYYHSVDINETLAAIKALKTIGTVDASRELIQLYNECLWRKVKIEVIHALGHHSHQRSLEFLFEISQSDYDLSLALVAIESLANSQSILTVRFLENLYAHGHRSKKMTIVLSLVKLGNNNCLQLFSEDLELCLANKEFSLAKNLIYAIGELRCHNKLDFLKLIVSGPYPKDIQLSAVTSIGKLSRDRADLIMFSDQFKNDAFEYQIFQQAQNHISFRSEWKLEDYLNKLFQSDQYHKNLPLELNAFSPIDVFAGLEVFFEPQNYKKVSDTLSQVNFKEVISWYKLFFKDAATSAEYHKIISQSLSAHFSDDCLDMIKHLSEYNLDYAHAAAVTCLPSAESYFKNFIMSPEYKNGSDLLKIKTLNYVVDYLAISQDTKIRTSMAKFFENELLVEPSTEVKNRIIRVMAQSKLPQNKIFGSLKSFQSNANAMPSILFYLEHHATPQTATYLKEHLNIFINQPKVRLQLLKAVAAQEAGSFQTKDIAILIDEAFNTKECKQTVEALKFLSKNPNKDFKTPLIQLTKSKDIQTVLNAIIALKSLPDDDIPDMLSPLLNSPSESIRGRALDAILNNKSLRAKRICIDFLKDQINNIECSEKIIRELSKSDLKSEYFLSTISDLIKMHPEHQLIQSMIELQEMLRTQLQESRMKNIPSAADLIAIDREILAKLPHFNKYDETIKVSLRSAEVPFSKPELFDQFVDKSVCILGFTKAIDIFLDKYYGKKILLPKIEARLHEFQNLVHSVHLNEDYPESSRVLNALNLENHFSAQSLPVHKMTLIGKGLLSSKIINDQFKVLDGLRAWAITFLLFTRKLNVTNKSLVSLNIDEGQCIDIAKKLMWLQDLRNPVAHRHTLTQLDDIKEARNESYRLLALLEKVLM